MELKSENGTYVMTLGKKEMITLISIVQEGVESVKAKSKAGNKIAAMKLDDAQLLVDELKKQIMDEN